MMLTQPQGSAAARRGSPGKSAAAGAARTPTRGATSSRRVVADAGPALRPSPQNDSPDEPRARRAAQARSPNKSSGAAAQFPARQLVFEDAAQPVSPERAWAQAGERAAWAGEEPAAAARVRLAAVQRQHSWDSQQAAEIARSDGGSSNGDGRRSPRGMSPRHAESMLKHMDRNQQGLAALEQKRGLGSVSTQAISTAALPPGISLTECLCFQPTKLANAQLSQDRALSAQVQELRRARTVSVLALEDEQKTNKAAEDRIFVSIRAIRTAT